MADLLGQWTARSEHSNARGYRTDIQALRGLAVLWVVLFHAGVPVAAAGFLGVDMFFTVSGFVITRRLMEGMSQGAFSAREFFCSRAWRLLPAACVCYAVVLMVGWLLMTPIEWWASWAMTLGAIGMVSNVLLWRRADYFGTSAEFEPLLHTWSLAVEEQFYLIFPFALLLVVRRFWPALFAMILVVSLTLALWAVDRYPAAAFYLPVTRAWQFMLGALAALWVDRYRAQSEVLATTIYIAATTLLVCVPISGTTAFDPGTIGVVCVATTALLLFGSSSKYTLARLSPLAWLGDRSYSVYLAHWPPVAFANLAWIGGAPLFVRVAVVALGVVLGVALHAGVEKRFRRRIQMPYAWADLRVFAGFAVAVLLVGLATLVVGGADHVEPPANRPNFGLSANCSLHKDVIIGPECRTAENVQVLVWGDSYAMHLVEGLVDTSGHAIGQATKSVCPPLVGYAPDVFPELPLSEALNTACLKHNRAVLEMIELSDAINTVILSAAWGQYPAYGILLEAEGESARRVSPNALDVARALAAQVARIRQLGIRVFLVGAPALGAFDVGTCLQRANAGKLILGSNSDCRIRDRGDEAVKSWVEAMEQEAATIAGLQVINIQSHLCESGICDSRVDGIPLYRDAGHLSYEGSVALARSMHWAQLMSIE